MATIAVCWQGTVHQHYSSLLSRGSLERDLPQNIGKPQ